MKFLMLERAPADWSLFKAIWISGLESCSVFNLTNLLGVLKAGGRSFIPESTDLSERGS